jgi:hypothetical protein
VRLSNKFSLLLLFPPTQYTYIFLFNICHRRTFTFGQRSDLFLSWHLCLFSHTKFKAMFLGLCPSTRISPPSVLSPSASLCLTFTGANFKLFNANFSSRAGRNFHRLVFIQRTFCRWRAPFVSSTVWPSPTSTLATVYCWKPQWRR